MIAIIGIVGVPACYGGFETLVENLLDEKGDYLVYCSSSTYKEKLVSYKGAKLKYVPINANGVSSIIYDGFSMLHAVFSGSKVLLVLGVSGCLLLPFLRLFTRKKIVTNIDGLDWRREKWGRAARIFLKLSERSAVRFSDVVVADNQGIADYVYSEYGVRPEVIAYGGDHVLTRAITGVSKGYSFGVCRIEPENNVHVILQAFSENDFPLKFIGNWDASEYGITLKKKYSNFPNIEIIDPVYDLDELFKYRDECSIYVHGHSAGGTNPSLVEAMFFGKQILAFDCVYNRATMHNEGLYFTSVESLVNGLKQSTNTERDISGAKMREIAHRCYSWGSIRKAYADLLV